MPMRAAALVAVLATIPAAAAAAPSAEEAAWLGDLTSAVVADLAAGRPLVVQVHVPLCDNDIIPCGNARLGDGDNPDTNLYWATSPGFGRWFTRKKSGWKQVLDGDGATVGDADVLDVRVFRRTVKASRAWRKAGAPARFDVYVVAQAWRGAAIDAALAAYAADLYGGAERAIELADGTTIAAGGAARIVAYVGHNRLMDVDAYAWPAEAPDAPAKGAVAIACHTASYMGEDVPAATRVPLLMTRDFLFANAAPLERAVVAFAEGGGYADVRTAAAEGYAAAQDRDVKKVQGAFTNPAHPKWKRRAR
jgi:hypothetical protein